MSKTGVLLLAAGSSSRMGRPKQWIPFGGKPLILHVLDQLSGLGKVKVVLGSEGLSHKERLQAQMPGLDCVVNLEWEEGMGASLRVGVEAFSEERVSHVLVALVDQPMVTRQHYQQLLQAATEHPDRIVAAAYADRVGAPVVFPKAYFPLLREASGDRGARAWLRERKSEVIAVEIPEAAADWDRPEDMEVEG